MRDHDSKNISKFNGLYKRGHPDDTPEDHFQGSNNMRHLGENIVTREGIVISQDINAITPLQNVRRIYNYPMLTQNSLLVLSYDPNTNTGIVSHVVNSTTQYTVLSTTGMTDFAFVPFGGRAYISPFGTFDNNGENVEKGLDNEFLYVYRGDGTAATKAAGPSLSGVPTIALGSPGHTDNGLHAYGFVSETDTGYLSSFENAANIFINSASNSVSFGSVPVSADAHVVRRHLVATKKITATPGYTVDNAIAGEDWFFVPGATIENNTDTFLNNISFFDADLLEDATHLLDNYSEIPAGAFLTLYHGRLVLGATFDDFNLVLVSALGEPEAISQIDGLLATQPNGFPVSNAAEFRDVLYVFRPNSTMAFTDNGDEPSTWPEIEVDGALGTRPHGIGRFLNSTTQSVDYLIIATYQGISIFNGGYATPELSWKIEAYWKTFDRNDFGNVEVNVNVVKKRIYIVTPELYLLVGFFQKGMNPKDIQWEPWTFVQKLNTLCVTERDKDILGSDIF